MYWLPVLNSRELSLLEGLIGEGRLVRCLRFGRIDPTAFFGVRRGGRRSSSTVVGGREVSCCNCVGKCSCARVMMMMLSRLLFRFVVRYPPCARHLKAQCPKDNPAAFRFRFCRGLENRACARGAAFTLVTRRCGCLSAPAPCQVHPPNAARYRTAWQHQLVRTTHQWYVLLLRLLVPASALQQPTAFQMKTRRQSPLMAPG